MALETVEQRGRSADAINVRKLRVELVADARLDQDILRAGPHQQTVQAHRHAIAGVGWDLFLPQRLRHHAEHLAAVEREGAVGKGPDVEVAQFHVQPSAASRQLSAIGYQESARQLSATRETFVSC